MQVSFIMELSDHEQIIGGFIFKQEAINITLLQNEGYRNDAQPQSNDNKQHSNELEGDEPMNI